MNTRTAAKKRLPKGNRRKTAKRRPAERRLAPISDAQYADLVDRVTDDVTDRLALATPGNPSDYMPVDLVERMIDGESPVRIWREHRGLRQVDLAAATGIKKARLSQIEHGASASVEKMAALAAALGVSMDDLV